ncbi:CUB domain protein [Cooperia oncophora]
MTVPKVEIRAKSGYLWIRFHSDEMLEYKGFYASYTMVRSTDRKPNQHDCQIEHRHALDGYVGTKAITSNLALNFTGSLDCIWLLEVPHDYNIVLFINEFSLYAPNHCELNFFEVYSGTRSDKPLKRYCGVTAGHVFSSHHLMYIRFYLHDANRLRNTSISALYSSFVKLKNCSSMQLLTCGDENCVPQSLACNGRINCPYGNDERNCHVGILVAYLTVDDKMGFSGQQPGTAITPFRRDEA